MSKQQIDTIVSLFLYGLFVLMFVDGIISEEDMK